MKLKIINLDFRDKLAGIIDKETGYSEESKNKVLPELSTMSWCIRSSF
jgi:hypothetical protein